MTRSLVTLICVLGSVSLPSWARAQFGDPSKVTLKTTPVADGISVIEGATGFAGGNVGVSVGADGVFIIDDELAPMTAKLKTALRALSKKPVRFLVNTHWHTDHTGGNVGMAGDGAVILAQDNTRKRLSVEQVREFMGKKITMPALPPAGLPVITFAEDVTLHLNGDDIHVVHVPPAHTDGDAIVHFTKANVIHAGDVVVGTYPVIDVDAGGQIDGFLAATDKILALANDQTKIIPGHGPLMTKADVVTFRDMVKTVRDRVYKLADQKKSLEEIKAAKPLADLDARWGQGLLKADNAIEMVLKSRSAGAPAADKHKDK